MTDVVMVVWFFYLNENVITWVSQKQRCVALSSCEAEFMAATASVCQAIWLRNVLSQITSEFVGPALRTGLL